MVAVAGPAWRLQRRQFDARRQRLADQRVHVGCWLHHTTYVLRK
jgi:hypothetical protein